MTPSESLDAIDNLFDAYESVTGESLDPDEYNNWFYEEAFDQPVSGLDIGENETFELFVEIESIAIQEYKKRKL